MILLLQCYLGEENNDTIKLIDYKRYKNRLESFTDAWTSECNLPSRLAKAGFYFLGTYPRIKCIYCKKKIDGDCPDTIENHKEMELNCLQSSFSKFFMEIITNSIFP